MLNLLYKRKNFKEYSSSMVYLPENSLTKRIYDQYGEVGLLRHVFGREWETAINCDIRDIKTSGIRHSDIVGQWLVYVLLDMEDAVLFKLKSTRPIEINDLRQEMVLTSDADVVIDQQEIAHV